jgi:putative transposase
MHRSPTIMRTVGHIIYTLFFSQSVLSRLAIENLALRQQLAMFKQQQPRPRIKNRHRLFWVVLFSFWPEWRTSLVVVKPETVIRWHKKGFKLFWRWKSRATKLGRPPIDEELRSLILKMARGNPGWGAPRIHGELAKLGFRVSERTVSRLLPRHRPGPTGQKWKNFLINHRAAICSMDFFIVPKATFRLLYVLVILSHDRRKVVHFNVTDHPTCQWTIRQVTEAFSWETRPQVSDQRQRWYVWQGLATEYKKYGDTGNLDRPTQSLAQWVCRAINRFDSSRVV